MTETDLQNAIRITLSAYGIVIRMNTGYFKTVDGRTIKCGVRGLSDLLFIGQDHIAFIEVKSLSGKPTPEQLDFIRCMKLLGHRAGIARNISDALELIK